MMPIIRKITLALFLLVLLLCNRSSAWAQDLPALILDNPETRYSLDLHLEYLEDPEGTLTIEQVTQPEISAGFTPNTAYTPNFGVTQSVYWIRFHVRNQTSFADWRLAFSNARMGLIDLYVPAPDGSGWIHQQAGTYVPVTTRSYTHPHFVFPLLLPSSGEETIYMRLQSNLPIRLTLSLWQAQAFEQYNHTYFLLIGLFYGIVIIMLFYHLLLYLLIRRKSYLYYFFFILFYTLSTAASDGTAHLYLFPGFSFKNGLYILATFAVIFAVLFIREFLELKTRLSWLNKFLISLAVIQVISLVLYGTFPQMIAVASIIILLLAIFSIIGGLLVWRQGLVSARVFLLGWFVLLLNAILFNSTNINLIRSYSLFDLGQYISTLFLVIFLALAMADQVNLLKTKAIQAENAMRASEKRFRHLYERTPLGIIIADPKGKFQQANRAFQKLLGYDERELNHMSYLQVLYPEDRETVAHNFNKLSQSEQISYAGEVRYLRKDGNPVWVSRTVSALRDENGEIQYTFGMVSDISERKKQETELRQYSENLEEMVAARTRELERSREQLIILNRSSQVVNTAGLDFEQVYIAIRAAAAWLVPAEVFSLCLVDQVAGQCQEVFLADGDQRLPGSSHPLAGSFIEAMLVDGTTLKVDDFQSDSPKEAYLGWVGSFSGIRSGIAVLLRGRKDVFGVLSVQSYQPQAYQDTDQSILESFAAHAAITLENIQLYQQAEKSAVVEERQRLARELHDSVTQLLYSMALMSGGWSTKARQGEFPAHAEQFGQIEELSLQALKEMRLLIHQLSPSILGEVGLLQALQNRLEAVEKRVNVDAQLHFEGNFPDVSPIVEEEIYFIIQEALNNALRHAHATRTQVVVQSDGRQLRISIEDNGRGYDPSLPSGGMGSTTMRERASAIGALVQTTSSSNQGTKVTITLPLRTEDREYP